MENIFGYSDPGDTPCAHAHHLSDLLPKDLEKGDESKYEQVRGPFVFLPIIRKRENQWNIRKAEF